MYLNKTNRKYYSNILTKGIKNSKIIDPSMIIKKDLVDTKRKRDGTETPVYDFKLNVDFWKNINEPISVILDEAHSIINSRRSMSKTNVIMTDWLALIRRVLGQSEGGYGELLFITQLPNRIDNIAREMATQIHYHRCHYHKSCKKCGSQWQEHSEMPEVLYECYRCGSFNIIKHNYVIEVWQFSNMSSFNFWKDFGQKVFYKHYFITDIERYFPMYNTLQWDNLFSDLY